MTSLTHLEVGLLVVLRSQDELVRVSVDDAVDVGQRHVDVGGGADVEVEEGAVKHGHVQLVVVLARRRRELERVHYDRETMCPL